MLTVASESYGLSHRTLGVLKALLTFLPTRNIPLDTVVFPSNRRLSERLSGMPESTLRRHLAQLAHKGIVRRRDSPNRKRYARRINGGLALAYGFDLTPLVLLQPELAHAAKHAREQAERIVVLRDNIMLLKSRLIATNGPEELIHETAKLLRRKADYDAFQDALERLENALDDQCSQAVVTQQTSGTVSQNERHIQDSFKYDLDTENIPRQKHTSIKEDAKKSRSITIGLLTNICRAFQTYFPDRIRGWHDIERIGDKLAPMLGIDQPVMHQAQAVMGHRTASVVVICMLENINKIRSPGAYLRHLIKLAGQGAFSVLPMLNALKSRELSADNVNYA